MSRYLKLTLISIFLSLNAWGQRMVYDSLKVNFGNNNNQAFGVCINELTDKRNSNPNFIGVFESNKYLFVPVDKYIALDKSLIDNLRLMFSENQDYEPLNCFNIEVKEFVLSTRNQFFTKKYVVHSILSVSQLQTDNQNKAIGHLIYEVSVSKRGKSKIGFEAALESWKEKFTYDMIKLSVCPRNDSLCLVPNLVSPSYSIRKQLMVGLESSFWIDTWLLDAELFFSKPESEKRFFRKAYGFRYRKQDKFQSFESIISNDQYHIRLSKYFTTVTKSKLYLGLNLWNDEEYSSRGFEDVFLLDYSMGQSLIFNPYYKRGITASLGIMGSLTYIYSEGVSAKPFILFQIGFKI